MKKINWKPAAILYGIILLGFFGSAALIKADTNFDTNTVPAVQSTTGPDGRTAVGSTEYVKVQISPALAWEKSKNGTGVWRAMGWIIILLLGVFIALSATGTIILEKSAYNWCLFTGMAVAAACIFAAYSSAFANNYVELTRAQYDSTVTNLAQWFDKPLIK